MALTPLLLLPGLMNDERVWAPVREALPHGRIVVPGQTHTADNMAALAAAALDSMPEGRFAVAGFSLGGYVTLELCRQAPERVAGIALLDTSAQADTAEARQNRQRMIDAITSGTSTFEHVASAFPPRLLHPDHVNDPRLLALLADMGRTIGADGFVRQQKAAMNREDRRATLAMLDCPALVVCGREDVTTPPDRSQEMAQLLKGEVELVLVPGAGHLTTLEQPAIVVEHVLRWLDRVDASAAAS